MGSLRTVGITCVLSFVLVADAAAKRPHPSSHASPKSRRAAAAQSCDPAGATCVSGASVCTDSPPPMLCSSDSPHLCLEKCGQLTCPTTQVCDYSVTGNCVAPCTKGSCPAGLGCCLPTGDCVTCRTPNSDGTCCIPKACGASGSMCGTVLDGCGGTLNCGACGNGYCLNGGCVACTPGQVDTSGCQQGDCNTSANPASRTCDSTGNWKSCTNQLVSTACAAGNGAGPGCSADCTCNGRQCPGGTCSVQGVTCNPACGAVTGFAGQTYDVQCNGSVGCAPCSAPAPQSCQVASGAAAGCAGFQCGGSGGCTPLEKHTSWTTTPSVSLTKTFNDKDGQYRCTTFWSWTVPQPPVTTSFSIDIKGWETNCSTNGTSFIVQATCSSFFSGPKCVPPNDPHCTVPCGNVSNVHQDGLQLWDVDDLHNQATYTLTCPYGDAVYLTKLGQTGTNGNGCTYELQVMSVSVKDYCAFDSAQSQYLCGR
jgi:hypothetical protein